jgi:hypothetical protein
MPIVRLFNYSGVQFKRASIDGEPFYYSVECRPGSTLPRFTASRVRGGGYYVRDAATGKDSWPDTLKEAGAWCAARPPLPAAPAAGDTLPAPAPVPAPSPVPAAAPAPAAPAPAAPASGVQCVPAVPDSRDTVKSPVSGDEPAPLDSRASLPGLVVEGLALMLSALSRGHRAEVLAMVDDVETLSNPRNLRADRGLALAVSGLSLHERGALVQALARLDLGAPWSRRGGSRR